MRRLGCAEEDRIDMMILDHVNTRVRRELRMQNDTYNSEEMLRTLEKIHSDDERLPELMGSLSLKRERGGWGENGV